MRHIFLDIDGVVATNATYSRWRKAGSPETFDAYVGLLDPALVAEVDRLAQEAGAGIVVSSSWREPSTQPYLVEDVLRSAGITVPIVGRTPVLALPTSLRIRGNTRGYEINAYVVAYDLALEDFVVFDDDTGASASPPGSPVRHGSRVIFTPEATGIGKGHLRRARKLFGLPPL
jgi:hypothetical protein